MIQANYSTAEIDQHMRGQAWHIESFGNERNEADPTCRHSTTAWTVYIYRHLDDTYEVAQWSDSAVYKMHTVQIRCDGTLTCTCPAGKQGFIRSKRGFCNHINRLMVHALRRLPTLPAPAGELAALSIARKAAPQEPPAPCRSLSAANGGHRRPSCTTLCAQLRFTEHTVSVTWMPC